MDVLRIVDRHFLTQSVWGRSILPIVTTVLMIVANMLVFLLVPNEREMGAIQRVFYFHVGSAFTTYAMIGVMFVAGLSYLATLDQRWDLVGAAAGGVAFLFCSVVLLSGMIWGHSAWNTWWRWEPRLVSFLILWLILFSYVLLRQVTQGEGRQAGLAAVLAIVAAINVPIVMLSIKFLSHAEQLHPEVIGRQGIKDPRFYYALVITSFSLIAFSCWLCWVKLTKDVLAQDLERIMHEHT